MTPYIQKTTIRGMLNPSVAGEGETEQLHVQNGVTLIFHPSI
jgi:hypothetical protein